LSIAERTKRNTRSPSKPKRRQQLQLDTIFPAGKRQRGEGGERHTPRHTAKALSPTAKSSPEGVTRPRALFSPPKAAFDPMFQEGFTLLAPSHSSTPGGPHSQTPASDAYLQWMDSTGIFLTAGRPTRERKQTDKQA
jgi:hypothetical protein